MLIRLICWILGHKTIVKASTGDTFETINQMTGLPQTGHYYVFEKKPFCVRCGYAIPTGSVADLRLVDFDGGRKCVLGMRVQTPNGPGIISGYSNTSNPDPRMAEEFCVQLDHGIGRIYSPYSLIPLKEEQPKGTTSKAVVSAVTEEKPLPKATKMGVDECICTEFDSRGWSACGMKCPAHPPHFACVCNGCKKCIGQSHQKIAASAPAQMCSSCYWEKYPNGTGI